MDTMDMSMPFKVSICIPTYNRAEQLDLLLGCVCPMIAQRFDPGVIEVCVSDNASSDQTVNILQKYSANFPFLLTRRNDTNIGFGRNLWATAEMAKGEYVYFSGDDDEFCLNGLDVLLDNVTKLSADLILFNSHPTHESSEQAIAVGDYVRLDSQNDYLKKLGVFHASFIGNLCFKKSAFLENSNIGDAIHLSAYPHMFPVLRILRTGSCVFVNSPITLPDDSFRGWHRMQPVYTSVDMARIMKAEAIPYVDYRLGWAIKKKLARSIPRAVFVKLRGQIKSNATNPFQSLSLSNLYSIYK